MVHLKILIRIRLLELYDKMGGGFSKMKGKPDGMAER